MSWSSVLLTNLKFFGSNLSGMTLSVFSFFHIWKIQGTLQSLLLIEKESSAKSFSYTKWKNLLNFPLLESFLNDFGKINEIVSANSQHFFINFIANDDWRPKGGLPLIWTQIWIQKNEIDIFEERDSWYPI